MPRAGRADTDAGRYAFLLGNVLVVNAVDAQRAFFHHAIVVIELTSAIRARPGTQLATDTGLCIDQDDAILLTFVRSASGTNSHTIGLIAMQAGTREMHSAARITVCHLISVHTIEPHTMWITAVSIQVRQRCRMAA